MRRSGFSPLRGINYLNLPVVFFARVRYKNPMAKTRDPDIYAAPSPLPPTKAELEEWNALTRDEQVARYRAYFAEPDCNTFTSETPDEILTVAQAKVAAKERG